MGLIRSTLSLAFLGLFILVGLTVPIGERTLFGHVSNIWKSNEAQELVDGVKDSSGPLVDRVKRGVEAGLTDEPGAVATTPQGAPQKPGEDALGPDSDGEAPIATTETTTSDGDLPQ
jgi:hypothetical protein